MCLGEVFKLTYIFSELTYLGMSIQVDVTHKVHNIIAVNLFTHLI